MSLSVYSLLYSPPSHQELPTLHCSGLLELSLSNLPPKFRAVSFRNVTHLRVGRNALQTENLLHADFQHVDQLLLEAKSIHLVDSSSRIELNITDCYHVEFSPRSVSASAGDLFLHVRSVDTLKIAGQAFDVLQRVKVDSARKLLVNPLSFKPNVLWSDMVDLEVDIAGVEDLPVLPSGAFSSTKSIRFADCNIKEVRGKSFSGNQVDRIAFEGCAIDKLHSNAFSEGLLLGNLSFHKCHLQAVSERAVRSPVTSLRVSESKLVALNARSFSPSLVVQVAFERNEFMTLGSGALVFGSWNEVTLAGNVFRFLEAGALEGFEAEGGGGDKKAFRFVDNVVLFANMGALKHALPEDQVALTVRNNTFMHECSCEVREWLDLVAQGPEDSLVTAAEDGEGLADLVGLLKNTSYCNVADFQATCFNRKIVPIPEYTDYLCQARPEGQAPVDPADVCVSAHLEIWRLVEHNVEISKTKGILLVILVFALFVSLLLSIYTLLRWIVYTLQVRHHRLKNEEEWNFTKVEERVTTPKEDLLVSPDDHYERLPFMNEEPERIPEEDEEEEEEEEKEEGGGGKAKQHQSPRVSHVDETRKKEAAKSNRNSVGLEPPKMASEATFYDEMIDLLKEKLEDPDNYGTVADSTVSTAPPRDAASSTSEAKGDSEKRKSGSEQHDNMLYQDPLEVNK